MDAIIHVTPNRRLLLPTPPDYPRSFILCVVLNEHVPCLFILLLSPNCVFLRDGKVRLEIAFFTSIGTLFLFEVPRVGELDCQEEKGRDLSQECCVNVWVARC